MLGLCYTFAGLLHPSFCQVIINNEISKEYYGASKDHANGSSFLVARATVDLVHLEEALGITDATWGCAICCIGADSKSTNKVGCIWHQVRRLPHSRSSCWRERLGCLHSERAELVQLQ